MRNWINLCESNSVLLYHATSADNAEACLAGMHDVSYWATEQVVEYYAEDYEDCAVLVISLDQLDEALIEPDFPGIEEPVVYSTMGKTEKQVWAEWEGSAKTWRDSLAIIGSIRYRGTVMPQLED